ncbi:hypothetical protein BD626DRAFT_420785 [Schizophyllum amplum]|uniref:BTB domain-containing protein n=1 Tax=Schizophyllum amplum TaxID=97359 RepID=A0A550CVY2_9AGAR|nr:hypothetical protein BD626DRAFT_420785 [Auriculariopsis ampla]
MFAAEYIYRRGAVEGLTVRLPNILSIDFERFLSLIYPSAIGECDLYSVDEWTSVLRLATKWSIPRLRALAIREIEPKASALDKIVIAREFVLGSSWLAPAFIAICSSPKWLEYEEAERLGLRSVVEVGRIREEHRNAGVTGCCYDVAAAVLASPILVPSPPVVLSSSPNGSTQDVPVSVAPQLPDSEMANEATAGGTPLTIRSDVASEIQDEQEPSVDPCASSEPLDRALHALNLANCNANHGMPAGTYRIVEELLLNTKVSKGPAAFSYTFSKSRMIPGLAVQRVRLRVAVLVARELLRRSKISTMKNKGLLRMLQRQLEERLGSGIYDVLTVSIPNDKNGSTLLSAVRDGLTEKHLVVREIPSSSYSEWLQLEVTIPRRNEVDTFRV